VSSFTHSNAKVEPKEGGEFFYFGGSIHGTFESIVMCCCSFAQSSDFVFSFRFKMKRLYKSGDSMIGKKDLILPSLSLLKLQSMERLS
jgi:hypothetical protein